MYFIEPPLPDWLKDVDARVQFGLAFAKRRQFVSKGDPVIIVTGWKQGSGFTNTMRIVYAFSFDSTSRFDSIIFKISRVMSSYKCVVEWMNEKLHEKLKKLWTMEWIIHEWLCLESFSGWLVFQKCLRVCICPNFILLLLGMLNKFNPTWTEAQQHYSHEGSQPNPHYCENNSNETQPLHQKGNFTS